MAMILKANGGIDRMDLSIKAHQRLEQMREAIGGGYVEFVRTIDTFNKQRIMVVDDSGLIKDLPLNKIASVMAGRQIVGDVLLLTPEETEDEMNVV